MPHNSILDTFPKLLLDCTRQHPDKIAMREKALGIWQTWTWRQMYDEVRALACGLASIGNIKPLFTRAHLPAPPGAPPTAPALRSQRRPLDGGGWGCSGGTASTR